MSCISGFWSWSKLLFFFERPSKFSQSYRKNRIPEPPFLAFIDIFTVQLSFCCSMSDDSKVMVQRQLSFINIVVPCPEKKISKTKKEVFFPNDHWNVTSYGLQSLACWQHFLFQSLFSRADCKRPNYYYDHEKGTMECCIKNLVTCRRRFYSY